MNTAVREAHLRLLATLPVYTHKCAGPVLKEKGQRYSRVEIVNLRARLVQLEAEGLNRGEMCLECHTTNKTIRRLIGPARVHR